MATLFNEDISDINIEDLSFRLSESKLNDLTVENEIVGVIEDFILECENMLSLGGGYLSEVMQFSSKSVSLSHKRVLSEGIPTIEANRVEIDFPGSTVASGGITKSNSATLFSSSFWRELDNVGIENVAISAYGLESNFDAMMTTNLRDVAFLGRGSGQNLISCQVENRSGGIFDSSVNSTAAINIGDAKRGFHEISNGVQLNIKTLKSHSSSFYENSVMKTGGRMHASEFITIRDDSSFMSENTSTNFLLKTGLVSNDAKLSASITNISTVAEAVIKFEERCMPVSGWVGRDVVVSDFISSMGRESIVDSIMNNLPLSAEINPYKIVSSYDLSQILEEITRRIADTEVC